MGAAGEGGGNGEMKSLAKGKKKKMQGIIYTCELGWLYSAPIGLIVNLFLMAPIPGRSVWV